MVSNTIIKICTAIVDMVFSILAAVFLVQWQNGEVHGYSLTNATDSVLGCSHNSTRFGNGSFVPTIEPCLNCKCINANLICALRVCPEQAFPPPRGCVIVQKKNSCCPYMTCNSKLHTTYKDQEKKVITYDRKWYEQNIRNRIFSQNALQRKIEDSDEEQQLSNGKMCVHNGTVYRSGSAMTTSSLCRYCYCIEGKQKCIQPKCTLPAKGCEPILIDSSCCPVRYDCTESKSIKARYNTKYNRRRSDNKHYLRMTSRMQRSRGCLVNSTFYPEGHKLPANQTNPCEICFCIGGSKRCAPKKCAPMIRNCRPIIPDGQCCPSSYDCKTVSDHKTGRRIRPRQYSDFFSLLFGDEDKENSTASSWDYETETETETINSTNEKSILDAIKDGLNYVEENNKQSSEIQTSVPNQTVQLVSSLPNYNISDNDDNDEDEEEISLLDFFLKGESALSSTTIAPFTFNVTGKPLLNGMTNSPMQIQPILPDNMRNESIKFSMLPMSLYNMVKEDGTVQFDGNQTLQIVSSSPSGMIRSKHTTVKENQSKETPHIKSEIIQTTMMQSDFKTTTQLPKQTNTMKIIEVPTETVPKSKPQINLKVHVSNQTMKTNKTESVSEKNFVNNKTESTTQKDIVETTTKLINTFTSKPTKKTPEQNVTQIYGSTMKSIISTTTMKAINKTTATTSTTIPSTKIKVPAIRVTTSTVKITDKPTALVESYTTTMQSLTTKSTTSLPKIIAVPINSNPSILESDMNYDYSEPTLPPSLPNLKIIPFLPTDAVKNSIHRNDDYKPNYNYYQSGPNYYIHPEIHVENSGHSPFNIKPDKHPSYGANVADDRIDYDTYKTPNENLDTLDYMNVYANGGNLVQPSPFQLSVNSKLDYGLNDQNVPAKLPSIINKNLTHVKPPLPPFEPEHEYNLYNLSPQTQLDVGDNYNEYYNVPQFVTITPLKEHPNKPASGNKDTVFSNANKNKFIPPVKTEGGFIPKRTGENYIPLRGSGFYTDNKEMDMDSAQNSTDEKLSVEEWLQSQNKNNSENLSQSIDIFDKNMISITTENDFKSNEEYNNAFLGVQYKKPSEKYELANKNFGGNMRNNTIVGPIEKNISFNSLYGLLFSEEQQTTSSPETTSNSNKVLDAIGTITQRPVSHATTLKYPQKNVTNNAIPLKLIKILNNTKKESPTKVEIPQRKNNKIIDPTDEPLVENMNTEMPVSTKDDSKKNESLTILRDVFLSTLNRPPIGNGNVPEDILHKSPLLLSRPINKFEIRTASFSNLNSLETKHNFHTNPIRSELDLIIPELNKNKQANDFSHTNNFSLENYQVLPAEETNIANTEAYVVNPVGVDKLKQHQSNGQTQIYTPPHKIPTGLLKLDGCNIYGRMYRVGKIIAELSNDCLTCFCTEVGVSCTPLNC